MKKQSNKEKKLWIDQNEIRIGLHHRTGYRRRRTRKIRLLVNSRPIKNLLTLGLNYTATYQDIDKTLERAFARAARSSFSTATLLSERSACRDENRVSDAKSLYLGQFGVLPKLKRRGSAQPSWILSKTWLVASGMSVFSSTRQNRHGISSNFI